MFGFEKLFYLGFALSPYLSSIVARADDLPHAATEKFSDTVFSSLSKAYPNTYAINTVDIRNYPAAKKLFFGPQCTCLYQKKVFFLGFINLMILKHVSRALQLLIFLILDIQNPAKSLVVHGSHTPYMLFAWLHCLAFKSKSIIILTDLHGKPVSSDNKIGAYLRILDFKIYEFLLRQNHGYICLSKGLVKPFMKNSVVFPGIVSHKLLAAMPRSSGINETKEGFTIAFAGALTIENGVKNLVDSLHYLSRDNIRIKFIGKGPLAPLIQDLSASMTSVVYEGFLSGQQLAQSLCSANILVNPRPLDRIDIMQSFPSKLLEYMVSKVPILTTRISLPDDIADCFFYIEDFRPAGIASSIDEISSVSPTELRKKSDVAFEKACLYYSEESFSKVVSRLMAIRKPLRSIALQ